jgi:cytidyltransferase-like protein
VGKVVDISELSSIVERLHYDNKKVVLCHGVFDILHYGHILHFEAAKNFGDVLVVTITPDEFVGKRPTGTIFDEKIRAEMIAKQSCVDYVAINLWDKATNAILLIKPDFYAKGKDYIEYAKDISGGIYEETEAVESVGGLVVFTDEISFSTSNLINRTIYSDNTYEYLRKVAKVYSIHDIIKYIDAISNLRILIIGETIYDEYQYGKSLGKSGKSPVIAFNTDRLDSYEGGALAIYNHIRGFCNNIGLISTTAVTKTRFIDGNQKIFETYRFEYRGNPLDKISDCIEDYDVVLVSDFGHGMIDKESRAAIKSKAKFLVVNAQRNAGNVGYNTIQKYWDRKHSIFFCIDEDELRMAFHSNYDINESLNTIVSNEFNNNIIVTAHDSGCLVNGSMLPSLSTTVVDTVGAGDAFLSVIAPLVYLKTPLDLVGFIGNVVGAIKVSYINNSRSITKKELYKFIETILK